MLTVSVILNGLGASVLWVAQGEYFSKCATEESKGFYFGLFWSIYQGSQILGSFFGGLIFGQNYSKTLFFIIMSSIALLATISFGFTRRPYVHLSQQKEQAHLSNEDLYYTSGLDSMAESKRFSSGRLQEKFADNTQSEKPSPSQYTMFSEPVKKKTNFIADISSTLMMLISKEMLIFWPQMIWTGTSIAYWSGLLTPIMTM